MLNVVIFGAPGSGKGTQSANLIEKYNLAHISTGDVLRAERDSGSELGKLAETYMSKGQLIPDDLMIDILANVFDERTKDGNYNGVVFDGFPRTVPQGWALNDMLQERGQKVDVVISLDVPEEELIKRLLNRGAQVGRSDDNYDVIKARLDVYYNQTTPLKDLYKERKKLYPVDGIGTVDEIFDRISKIIDEVK